MQRYYLIIKTREIDDKSSQTVEEEYYAFRPEMLSFLYDEKERKIITSLPPEYEDSMLLTFKTDLDDSWDSNARPMTLEEIDMYTSIFPTPADFKRIYGEKLEKNIASILLFDINNPNVDSDQLFWGCEEMSTFSRCSSNFYSNTSNVRNDIRIAMDMFRHDVQGLYKGGGFLISRLIELIKKYPDVARKVMAKVIESERRVNEEILKKYPDNKVHTNNPNVINIIIEYDSLYKEYIKNPIEFTKRGLAATIDEHSRQSHISYAALRSLFYELNICEREDNLYYLERSYKEKKYYFDFNNKTFVEESMVDSIEAKPIQFIDKFTLSLASEHLLEDFVPDDDGHVLQQEQIYDPSVDNPPEKDCYHIGERMFYDSDRECFIRENEVDEVLNSPLSFISHFTIPSDNLTSLEKLMMDSVRIIGDSSQKAIPTKPNSISVINEVTQLSSPPSYRIVNRKALGNSNNKFGGFTSLLPMFKSDGIVDDIYEILNRLDNYGFYKDLDNPSHMYSVLCQWESIADEEEKTREHIPYQGHLDKFEKTGSLDLYSNYYYLHLRRKLNTIVAKTRQRRMDAARDLSIDMCKNKRNESI